MFVTQTALRASLRMLFAALGIGALALGAGCSREDAKPPPSAVVDVTTLTVLPADVPVVSVYVAQTQSSQQVNIQARVSGFLDQRVYTEGAIVKAGQVMFRMDQKPFQAQVDAAAAALQRNQAAMGVAKANLDRTKPLVQLNALSKKDLDDAQGQYEQTAAAVEQSKAQLEEAKLNLSYTVIASPVTGISSYAQVADGSYVNAQNSQLTTVAVLSPMWVNFSISENQMQRIREQLRSGHLRFPPGGEFTVEIELVDGTIFPHTGKITFADPSYSAQTGTFLLRATIDNPEGVLRPNQFVRTRVKGSVRPGAILVPQRAVQQGAKGHFVWVVNKESKAELRPVVVGDWHGDDWFIAEGLAAGDQVVVDGSLRLAQGTQVRASAATAVANRGTDKGAGAAVKGATPASADAGSAALARVSTSVYFESGQSNLGPEAARVLATVADRLQRNIAPVEVTGYADRHGNRAANVALANARANAVRAALVAAGIAADRIRLKAPADVTGDGDDRAARRVEIATVI